MPFPYWGFVPFVAGVDGIANVFMQSLEVFGFRKNTFSQRLRGEPALGSVLDNKDELFHKNLDASMLNDNIPESTYTRKLLCKLCCHPIETQKPRCV
jgi:hypothetical protein